MHTTAPASALLPFVVNREKKHNLSQDRISNVETLQNPSHQLIRRSEIHGRDAASLVLDPVSYSSRVNGCYKGKEVLLSQQLVQPKVPLDHQMGFFKHSQLFRALFGTMEVFMLWLHRKSKKLVIQIVTYDKMETSKKYLFGCDC